MLNRLQNKGPLLVPPVVIQLPSSYTEYIVTYNPFKILRYISIKLLVFEMTFKMLFLNRSL